MNSGQDEDGEDDPLPEEAKTDDIDKLRETLARQILKLAIVDENVQLKLDAFKATERYGTRGVRPSATPVATPMANFHARVKRAEEGNGGEPAETD